MTQQLLPQYAKTTTHYTLHWAGTSTSNDQPKVVKSSLQFPLTDRGTNQ